MTLPMSDDFANRELSIEELEAIAAGGWFSSVVHGVEHVGSAVWSAVTSPVGNAVSTTLLILAGAILAGRDPILRNMKMNQN